MQVTTIEMIEDFKIQLEEFFDIKINDVSICICNPEEFKPFKFADFVVGRTIITSDAKLIYILDEKYTNYTHDDWVKVLKHELVHIFYNVKFNSSIPRWLNEGLACYLAGQEKPIVDITLNDLIKYNNSTDKQIYSFGYSAVKKLLEKDN